MILIKYKEKKLFMFTKLYAGIFTFYGKSERNH